MQIGSVNTVTKKVCGKRSNVQTYIIRAALDIQKLTDLYFFESYSELFIENVYSDIKIIRVFPIKNLI